MGQVLCPFLENKDQAKCSDVLSHVKGYEQLDSRYGRAITHVKTEDHSFTEDVHLFSDKLAEGSGSPTPIPLKDDKAYNRTGIQAAHNYYTRQAELYYDSVISAGKHTPPNYAPMIIRWEWHPWDLLTGYRKDDISFVDNLDRVANNIICVKRKHQFCKRNPFVRSLITFHYGEDTVKREKPIRVYEELHFNQKSPPQITFVEAWLYSEELIKNKLDEEGFPYFGPGEADDIHHLVQGEDGKSFRKALRLGDKVPGLGRTDGRIVPDGKTLKAAAATNVDLQTMCDRLDNWVAAAIMEHLDLQQQHIARSENEIAAQMELWKEVGEGQPFGKLPPSRDYKF